MKRLLVILTVVALVVALPTLQAKPSGERPVKVDVLHATDSAVVNPAGVVLIVGHVINVSENAVDAHLAHGDSLVVTNELGDAGPFNPNQTWADIAAIFGLNMAGATHAAFVLP